MENNLLPRNQSKFERRLPWIICGILLASLTLVIIGNWKSIAARYWVYQLWVNRGPGTKKYYGWERAAAKVKELGEYSIPPLVDLLEEDDTEGSLEIWIAAANILVEIGEPAVTTVQMGLLSPNEQIRFALANACWELRGIYFGTASAIPENFFGYQFQPQLIHCLEDESPRVRLSAAMALKELGRNPESMAQRITRIIEETNPSCR